MLFGLNWIDKTREEYLQEIAELARNRRTLIFLDTNILAYLYKLHAAARAEFYVWTDLVHDEDRLQIPAWSASEYLSKVTGGSLHSYTPKSKDADQAKRVLEGMFETAKLFVDDTALRSISFAGDRNAFLAGFKEAIEALPKFTGAFNYQFNPEEIHEEIQSHFSASIVDSDLTALCSRVARDGQIRIEHRIPPAFKDEDKPENRFGDLIIWLEILEHSKKRIEDFDNVLFISNDKKSDWVYAPQRRTKLERGVRRKIPNNQSQLKIVDPRLVAEFNREVGHKNITITTLASLIEGLSKDRAIDFEVLAAAIQIDLSDYIINADSAIIDSASVEPVIASDEDLVLVSPEQVSDIEAEGVEDSSLPDTEQIESSPSISEPRLVYESEALEDAHYAYDFPSSVNQIIRELRSYNWYTQNPAIDRVRQLRDTEASPSTWFVLGRNIYQAACGNSAKAMDFLGSLEHQLTLFPNEISSHLLSGMLFEIYFDSNGNFRSMPKARFIETPLQQVVKEEFSDVLYFIRFHLGSNINRLAYAPGSVSEFSVHVVSMLLEDDDSFSIVGGGRYILQSVVIDGNETVTNSSESNSNYILPFSHSWYSLEVLNLRIARTLAIPQWALKFTYDPKLEYTDFIRLPDDKQLNLEAAIPASAS